MNDNPSHIQYQAFHQFERLTFTRTFGDKLVGFSQYLDIRALKNAKTAEIKEWNDLENFILPELRTEVVSAMKLPTFVLVFFSTDVKLMNIQLMKVISEDGEPVVAQQFPPEDIAPAQSNFIQQGCTVFILDKLHLGGRSKDSGWKFFLKVELQYENEFDFFQSHKFDIVSKRHDEPDPSLLDVEIQVPEEPSVPHNLGSVCTCTPLKKTRK